MIIFTLITSSLYYLLANGEVKHAVGIIKWLTMQTGSLCKALLNLQSTPLTADTLSQLLMSRHLKTY